MGRIAVVHTYFNILGGGEYLALNLVESLSRKHSVTIYTVTKPNKGLIKQLFNIDIGRFNIVVREDLDFMKKVRHRFIRLKRLVSYRRIFTRLHSELDEYDLVIDTQSNIPTPSDLTYIHYPAVAEAFSGSPKSLYDYLVKFLYRKWFGKSMSGRIACNSGFTARAVYRYYHVIPDVIYPPVDTMFFLDNDFMDRERENIIVTVSRFTPEKNLDKIPLLARRLRKYRFHIVGFMDKNSTGIVDKLAEQQNIYVRTNLPREQLRKLIHRAKYYLHPLFREHFGISVVEAMSGGLVPIVYRDSGTCEEVVSKVDPRLCYKDLREVPEIIGWAERKYHELQLKSIRVSSFFDKKVFQHKILNYVENLMKTKGVL